MASTPDLHRNHVDHSAVPPYLRPTSQRNHSSSSALSNSSARSHPRPQNEYIPTTTGIAALVGTGEGVVETDIETRRLLDDEEEQDDYDEDADWDNIREGSINGRPNWRKPRPSWIYPFLIGTVLSVGMGIAPQSELVINLVCLAHPPQQHSSTTSEMYVKTSVPDVEAQDGVHWNGLSHVDSSINATLPDVLPVIPDLPLSAADKWFLKLQREIYEYRHAHPDASSAPRTTILPSVPVDPTGTRSDPTESRPRPTGVPGDNHSPAPPSNGSGNSPFEAINPKICKKDPGVQAAAAKLIMALTTTLGVLSALSVGYWGKTSDRIGRTKILAFIEIGLLINECVFITVATIPHRIPGGYRALVIGSIVNGFFGSFSCLAGTAHAYVSDVTPDGSRAAAFSKLTGMIMGGFACGPLLGAILIKLTDNIMTPFYVGVCVHALWIVLLLTLLPESLSTQARAHLAKKAAATAEAAKRKEALEREWEAEDPTDEPNESGFSQGGSATHSRRRKRFVGNTRRLARRAFHFLEPLTIFIPKERDDGKSGLDWNLTWVAFAIFCAALNYGVLQVKAQYTFYAFGWTTTQLAPYMSLAGASRGVVLLVIIPLVMKYAKPRYLAKHAAPMPTSVSSSSPTESPEAGDSERPTLVDQPTNIDTASSRLDLLTARISFLLESIGLVLLALNVSALVFVLITVFMTLGAGSPPALNSLALNLIPSKRESGRLFGALSVLHALGSTLLSPLLFGGVFSATVGTYAPTVFAMAAGFMVLAQVALVFVKFEHRVDDAERGRSTRVRRTKISSTGAE